MLNNGHTQKREKHNTRKPKHKKTKAKQHTPKTITYQKAKTITTTIKHAPQNNNHHKHKKQNKP